MPISTRSTQIWPVVSCEMDQAHPQKWLHQSGAYLASVHGKYMVGVAPRAIVNNGYVRGSSRVARSPSRGIAGLWQIQMSRQIAGVPCLHACNCANFRLAPMDRGLGSGDAGQVTEVSSELLLFRGAWCFVGAEVAKAARFRPSSKPWLACSTVKCRWTRMSRSRTAR